MSFGERLKNLRLEKGLTQEDVANEVCVTKQAVWKWEHDVSLPDIASLERIAQFFGVNIDYLLTGNDNVKIEEKIVEVEKEVVKEKIVEVDEPLSEALLESLLHSYQRLWASYYGRLIIGFFDLIVGIVLIAEIKPFDSGDALLIASVICFLFTGLLAIILGFISKKKYEARKKEIEQKTSKKISYWGFKDK